MPTILQLRRGSTAENDSYTGSVGELTVDTTLNKIRLHDGSTAGGNVIGGGSTGNIQVGETGDNEIDTSSGNLTIDSAGGTVTVDDNLTVSGNLTVNGTTTTVDSTNTTIADNLIELNSGAASNANDTGILIERGSTGDNAIIAWDESADKFTVGTTTATADSTGNLTITTGTLVANIEGNVTGDVTGNADTATALATARNIGGVSFDGSASINLPGVNTSGNQDTSGNAATATALETARTIAGQTFDGTANVVIASTNLSDTSNIALLTETQTLTNKTISGSSNTFSNIGNGSLSNSTITINGTSIALGASGEIAAGTDWQSVKTSAFTAVAGEGYFVNTTSAAITVTLPSSPSQGDEVSIIDYAGTFDTNNLTVARNGKNIQGSATDLTVSVERAGFTLVYADTTQGWLLKDK